MSTYTVVYGADRDNEMEAQRLAMQLFVASYHGGSQGPELEERRAEMCFEVAEAFKAVATKRLDILATSARDRGSART